MSKRESFHLAYFVPLVSHPHEKICYKDSSVEKQQIQLLYNLFSFKVEKKQPQLNLDQPILCLC